MNLSFQDFLFELLAVVGLLLLNALFVACEFSVIKLRLSQFNEQDRGEIDWGKGAARLLEEADSTIRTVRFGVIFCTVGYAVVVFPLLENWFSSLVLYGQTSTPLLAAFLAFLIAVSLHYVVGELVPRSIAVTYPQRALRSSVWAVWSIGIIARPLYRPLRFLACLLLKPFGAKPESELEALGFEEQLRALHAGSDDSPVYPRILKNALHLRDVKVQDILLPRNQVQFFDLEDGNRANIELAEKTEHTRFPLCEGDLDNCVGLVHIKDIFRSSVDLEQLDFRALKRDVIRVDPQDPVEEVLQKLLLSKTHMALVSDDFGGTVGVITLELIIEQLVGEIQDEFDAEEELISRVADREFLVSGLTPIRELEEALEREIEKKDDVATFGGLITSELGRIPDLQESLKLNGLRITVTEVDETRVISTRVSVVAASGDNESA